MMNSEQLIVPIDATGYVKHRLSLFADWINRNGYDWYSPDLAAYRDYLMSDGRIVNGKSSPLSARSAAAHLTTIRVRYEHLIKSNAIRDYLYRVAPAGNQKAFVDETITRMTNAIASYASTVKVLKEQDVAS